MGKNMIGRNRSACNDVAAERDDRRDLGRGKIRIAEIVPGIDDFNPNRARIDIVILFPDRHAGMPGAPRFGDELHDRAVLEHNIMTRHLAGGFAQAFDRVLPARHAGVVQDDDVEVAVARVVVGR